MIYRQTRVGAGGRQFTMLKFRTMRADAEPDCAAYTEIGDARVTRVGRVLRMTHLDELPQLWNVLKGEMSVVGPRPERPEFIPMLEEAIPFFSRRLLIKPGVTGWAQLRSDYSSDAEGAEQALLRPLVPATPQSSRRPRDLRQDVLLGAVQAGPVSRVEAAEQIRAKALPMYVETISEEAGFAELAGSWDELVRAMPRPSPFLLHSWLLEWWRHYGRGADLAVHVAYRGDHLVGALPLCTRRRSGLRVSEFVGGTWAILADALVAPGEDAQAVVAGLAARAVEGEHDFADLFGLPGSSRLLAALPQGSLRLVQRLEAPVCDLGPSWEAAYTSRLSSKTRSERRRRLRQLEKLGTVESEVARSRRRSREQSRTRSSSTSCAGVAAAMRRGSSRRPGSASIARPCSRSPTRTSLEASRSGWTAAPSPSRSTSSSPGAPTG